MENGKDGKMLESIKRAKAVKIDVKRIIDENPDMSFLETTPEYHYGKVQIGNMYQKRIYKR